MKEWNTDCCVTTMVIEILLIITVIAQIHCIYQTYNQFVAVMFIIGIFSAVLILSIWGMISD